jgi:hypothetical protein
LDCFLDNLDSHLVLTRNFGVDEGSLQLRLSHSNYGEMRDSQLWNTIASRVLRATSNFRVSTRNIGGG